MRTLEPSQRLPPPLVSIVGEYAAEMYASKTIEGALIPESYCQYRILQEANNTQLVLFQVLSGGKIDSNQKTHSLYQSRLQTMRIIQLRTHQLEDFAILQCFMSYCRTDILFRDTSNDLVDLALPLCLPENIPLPTFSCPLVERVERFLQLASSNQSFHQQLCFPNSSDTTAKALVFLPVTTGEPLDVLTKSLLATYRSHSDVQACVKERATLTQNKVSKLSHLTFPLKFLAISGFIVLYTATKVAAVMLSVVLACAIIAPVSAIFIANARGTLNWSNCTFSLLSSYFFSFATLGALGGLAFTGRKTLPHVKELWQARHLIFQLHEQSLSGFARLWVDYTNKNGYVTGTKQLLSDIYSNTVPDLSIERHA